MKRIYSILLFSGLFMSISINSMAQRFVISGQIMDGTYNEPLIGANVVEVDANGRFLNGTITDVNGNFVIKVSSGSATVQISMLGYEKQLVELNNQTTLNVTLNESTTALDAVTVVGEKKGNDGVLAIRDRGIAVSRIEFDEQLKSEMTTTSVEELLQGRLGNVDITAISGDPGAGLNIRIRCADVDVG